MIWFLLIFLFILTVLIVYVSSRVRRRTRRRLAIAAPFPDEWIQFLRKNIPLYDKLSAEQQRELQQDSQVFLAEKSFEGGGGLIITDEIKITIAAQACMLLINRKDDCYPKLYSVVVYPTAYVAGGKGLFNASEGQSVRLGESWGSGTVVLSWDHVRTGAFNFRDGRNVTMHEFAHQLDQEDGSADGVPILNQRSAYTSWARVFSKEFEQLQQKGKKKRRNVIDAYGATNPAEFFAVATESFFEKGTQLQKKHPDLYRELKQFYKIDPIEWEEDG